MYFLILLFLFCSIGIFITSYFSIDSIKVVANRFKLSETFIGTSFLAIGTSFPEFVNSITSGFYDRSASSQPIYAMRSFFNITGANMLQLVFLAGLLTFLSISLFSKRKKKINDQIILAFWEKNLFPWKIVFCETIALFLIFLFPKFFSGFVFNNFNLVNIPFLFIWIWYLSKTYQEQKVYVEVHDGDKSLFKNLSKASLLCVTVVLWLLFGAFAYGNFYVCTLFESKINIPRNVALGTILSLVTSLPEFCAFYFLFKKKEYLIAVSGIFGSSMFNLTLPTYTNLISGNPLFGSTANNTTTTASNGTTNPSNMVAWLALNIWLFLSFFVTFVPKYEKLKIFTLLGGLFTIALYVVGNIFISMNY